MTRILILCIFISTTCFAQDLLVESDTTEYYKLKGKYDLLSFNGIEWNFKNNVVRKTIYDSENFLKDYPKSLFYPLVMYTLSSLYKAVDSLEKSHSIDIELIETIDDYKLIEIRENLTIYFSDTSNRRFKTTYFEDKNDAKISTLEKLTKYFIMHKDYEKAYYYLEMLKSTDRTSTSTSTCFSIDDTYPDLSFEVYYHFNYYKECFKIIEDGILHKMIYEKIYMKEDSTFSERVVQYADVIKKIYSPEEIENGFLKQIKPTNYDYFYYEVDLFGRHYYDELYDKEFSELLGYKVDDEMEDKQLSIDF
ncbi:hypothetical protein [Flammeovirga aprica]|uniref:Uncharacterized protein n=1 Tax=Flammeovirga aprica JL-4 TaxID=694437 RepID=A0A7X9RZF7_9BACT|nr:hypothetical protein [Flammeovirga aprica]NME71580.1 hypothetical protein [Flammeovirga aprica JL-4]